MVQKNDRGSPLAIALIALAGAASCALFASKPPCNSDSNCPASQVCDLETKACVERAGTDSGVGPDDAGPTDGIVTDGAVADGAGVDAVAPDRAPTDTATADQRVPDAAGADLRRTDAARPDSWRPDTSAFDAAGCIDTDGDEYGTACARGPDCDDDDASVYEGTPCDDANAATSFDTCRNGLCRGVVTSAATCSGSCGSCPAAPCCTQVCASPDCGSCLSGCSCYFTFNSNGHDTALSCAPHSSCTLDVNNGRDVSTSCDHATCYQLCNSNSGSCTMNCLNGGSCIIFCDIGLGNCNITGCTSGSQTCSDGKTIVCNAACP